MSRIRNVCVSMQVIALRLPTAAMFNKDNHSLKHCTLNMTTLQEAGSHLSLLKTNT